MGGRIHAGNGGWKQGVVLSFLCSSMFWLMLKHSSGPCHSSTSNAWQGGNVHQVTDAYAALQSKSSKPRVRKLLSMHATRLYAHKVQKNLQIHNDTDIDQHPTIRCPQYEDLTSSYSVHSKEDAPEHRDAGTRESSTNKVAAMASTHEAEADRETLEPPWKQRRRLTDVSWQRHHVTEGNEVLYIVIVLLLVLVAGAMAGLTLGLMSLDAVDLEVLKRSGSPQECRWAERIAPLIAQPHHLLVTLLLVNAAANEALPIFLDRLVDPAAAVVLSTTVVLIFGEIIPQAVCSRYGVAIGGTSAWFVWLLMWLTSPVSWPAGKLLDWLLGEHTMPVLGRRQLKALVTLHGLKEGLGGTLTEEEIKVIRGALDLTSKTARKGMTPLDKVFMLEASTVIDHRTLMSILASGHSRIPVYRGTAQQEASGSSTQGHQPEFLGILLVKELLLVDPSAGLKAQDLTLRPLPQLPADTPMFELLRLFVTGRSHMVLLLQRKGQQPPSPLHANEEGEHEESKASSSLHLGSGNSRASNNLHDGHEQRRAAGGPLTTVADAMKAAVSRFRRLTSDPEPGISDAEGMDDRSKSAANLPSTRLDAAKHVPSMQGPATVAGGPGLIGSGDAKRFMTWPCSPVLAQSYLYSLQAGDAAKQMDTGTGSNGGTDVCEGTSDPTHSTISIGSPPQSASSEHVEASVSLGGCENSAARGHEMTSDAMLQVVKIQSTNNIHLQQQQQQQQQWWRRSQQRASEHALEPCEAADSERTLGANLMPKGALNTVSGVEEPSSALTSDVAVSLEWQQQQQQQQWPAASSNVDQDGLDYVVQVINAASDGQALHVADVLVPETTANKASTSPGCASSTDPRMLTHVHVQQKHGHQPTAVMTVAAATAAAAAAVGNEAAQASSAALQGDVNSGLQLQNTLAVAVPGPAADDGHQNSFTTSAAMSIPAAIDSSLRQQQAGGAAVDIDEGWEPIGIVTLEDVIEELMQVEILDETDQWEDNEQTKRVNAAALLLALPAHLRRPLYLPPELFMGSLNLSASMTGAGAAATGGTTVTAIADVPIAASPGMLPLFRPHIPGSAGSSTTLQGLKASRSATDVAGMVVSSPQHATSSSSLPSASTKPNPKHSRLRPP